jgi:hypothetical protein
MIELQEASRKAQEAGGRAGLGFPKTGAQDLLARGIAGLEGATGRVFGDQTNPRLVSVRSGAARPMPGMLIVTVRPEAEIAEIERWRRRKA